MSEATPFAIEKRKAGESVVGWNDHSRYGVVEGDGVTARKNETTSAAHPPRNGILDV